MNGSHIVTGMFVRAKTWYSAWVKFGVIVEIVGANYINVRTASGIYTCHRGNALECKHLTPADEQLLESTRSPAKKAIASLPS